MEPAQAPLGLQEVAMLVLAARSFHANGGLAGEDAVVAAFVQSVRAPLTTAASASAGTSPGPHGSAGRFTAKVAGAAAVLALGGATAAAATGSLPGSVQAAVSRNLSHLGIDVPDPQTGTSSSGVGSNAGAGHAGEGRSTALTAPSTTANAYGLCTAYFAPDGRSSANTTRGKALSSVAFSRLTAAAQAKGESVEAFCASIPKPGTVTSTSTGTSTGTSPGTGTGTGTGSDGTSSTDGGGKPATNPAGKTPGPPTTTPAGNTPGSPPATNPAGKTPGPPTTTPAGNTPGSPPATNPSGNTSGSQGTDKPPANAGNSATTPAGTAPGTTQTGAGQSGSHSGS